MRERESRYVLWAHYPCVLLGPPPPGSKREAVPSLLLHSARCSGAGEHSDLVPAEYPAPAKSTGPAFVRHSCTNCVCILHFKERENTTSRISGLN